MIDKSLFYTKDQWYIPHQINKALFERPRKSCGRDGVTYICTDGVSFSYRCEVVRIYLKINDRMGGEISEIVPRNGVQSKRRYPSATVVNGTQMDRKMSEIMCGSSGKMCAFPSTITIVAEHAFCEKHVVSVKFNEGLRILEESCFKASKIRKLVLPSRTESIGDFAFWECKHLECVDLSAAHGLRSIGYGAFCLCGALKYALLNDGLETMDEGCFSKSGLERVSIPNTVKCIHDYAFSCSSLTQVCFLGTTEKEPHCRHYSDNPKGEPSENGHRLVIGRKVFFNCENLK